MIGKRRGLVSVNQALFPGGCDIREHVPTLLQFTKDGHVLTRIKLEIIRRKIVFAVSMILSLFLLQLLLLYC